jgi:hypothetical protein
MGGAGPDRDEVTLGKATVYGRQRFDFGASVLHRRDIHGEDKAVGVFNEMAGASLLPV